MLSGLSKMKILKRCFASIVPRRVVLLIDMVLVLVSCIFSLYIVKTNNYSVLAFDSYNLIRTAIILVVFALMSRITKSYWGIIRYTGLEDAYRLFKMTTLSCVVLLVMSGVYQLLGHRFLSLIEIIELGIFTFTFILLERLAIKALYHRMTSEKSNRKRVIVLGSAINSVVLSNALLNEIDSAYEPVALLSLNEGRTGDNVNGLPIETYHPDKINDIFEKYNTKTLIFLATHMEMMKKGLADKFLEAGVELLLLNQVEEFAGDKDKRDVSSYVYNINIDDLLGREPIHTDNPHINKMMTGKVVLVTGAAGSIGSEIVRQIAIYKPAELVLIDQAETPLHDVRLEMARNWPEVVAHTIVSDISNRAKMEEIFQAHQPHYVFHAAAYKHVPMMEDNPSEAIQNNVYGTRVMADLAVKYGTKKFVMVSTDKAVNPTNVMGCSKRICEIYVQSLDKAIKEGKVQGETRFVTTRFGNVLGSNGSVIPYFRKQIEAGGPVTVTHPEINRFFMTIPEAVSLVLSAGASAKGGEIFVLDMGKPVRILDLAENMIRLSGFEPYTEIDIKFVGLRPGEKLYEELLMDEEGLTKTDNDLIYIGKPLVLPDDLPEKLQELIKVAYTDEKDIRLCLKEIVKTYRIPEGLK